MNQLERNSIYGIAQLPNGAITPVTKLSNARSVPTLQEAAATGGAVFIGTREVVDRVYRALLVPISSPDCHSTHTNRYAFGPTANGETTDLRIIQTAISQELADILMEVLDGNDAHAQLRASLGIRTGQETEAARAEWRGELPAWKIDASMNPQEYGVFSPPAPSIISPVATLLSSRIITDIASPAEVDLPIDNEVAWQNEVQM